MNINLGLEKTVRQQIAQQLGLILADMYLIYVKTQNFHWNIVDPRFSILHQFLEDQYKELQEAIDEVAERIRMLGEKTPATLAQFLEMSSLEESLEMIGGDEMLAALLKDHESIIKNLREQIDYSGKLNDQGTADLLIQRLRSHEKTAWMLRSHFNGNL
jgi:starvation-inducible DNA-binding protein